MSRLKRAFLVVALYELHGVVSVLAGTKQAIALIYYLQSVVTNSKISLLFFQGSTLDSKLLWDCMNCRRTARMIACNMWQDLQAGQSFALG